MNKTNNASMEQLSTKQVFIAVVFHISKGYDLILLYYEPLSQNSGRCKIKARSCINGKARNFEVGLLKFMDSYNSMGIMADVYKFPNKQSDLYENEQICYSLIHDLAGEDFGSSFTSKIPSPEEFTEFINTIV